MPRTDCAAPQRAQWLFVGTHLGRKHFCFGDRPFLIRVRLGDHVVMTFGGLAPFFVTWLLAATGWAAAPSAYFTIAALLSLCALTTAYSRGAR